MERIEPPLLMVWDLISNHALLGPKKYQNIERMYDRTGLSTKRTLMKTGFKNLRTGSKANFRPFVDALRSVYKWGFFYPIPIGFS